jgi:hypothetical protein
VTSATAIMYAFAPLSLAALHQLDGGRDRAYRVPMPRVLLPLAFCSANLIIYFAGFETTWKLMIAMVAGVALFAIGAARTKTGAMQKSWRNAIWIAPWFAGHVVIGALGRYGGGYDVIPDFADLGVVIGFSLVIYYFALGRKQAEAAVQAAIAKDAHQLESAGAADIPAAIVHNAPAE